MKFAVTRHWEVCDTVVVKADSPWDAIEAAHAMPLDNAKAAYVPDSINSDSTCDVQPITARARKRIRNSKPHIER